MIIKALHLQNIGSFHRKTTFSFGKLNAIIGHNQTGKSTTIRTIYYLLTGDAPPISIISTGKPFGVMVLETDGGDIQIKRTLAKTEWSIDGEKVNKEHYRSFLSGRLGCDYEKTQLALGFEGFWAKDVKDQVRLLVELYCNRMTLDDIKHEFELLGGNVKHLPPINENMPLLDLCLQYRTAAYNKRKISNKSIKESQIKVKGATRPAGTTGDVEADIAKTSKRIDALRSRAVSQSRDAGVIEGELRAAKHYMTKCNANGGNIAKLNERLATMEEEHNEARVSLRSIMSEKDELQKEIDDIGKCGTILRPCKALFEDGVCAIDDSVKCKNKEEIVKNHNDKRKEIDAIQRKEQGILSRINDKESERVKEKRTYDEVVKRHGELKLQIVECGKWEKEREETKGKIDDLQKEFANAEESKTTASEEMDDLVNALAALKEDLKVSSIFDEIKSETKRNDVYQFIVGAFDKIPHSLLRKSVMEYLDAINHILQFLELDRMLIGYCDEDEIFTINNRPISTLSESEHLRLNAATSLVLSRVCGHNVVLIDRLDASDNVHKGPMIEYLRQIRATSDNIIVASTISREKWRQTGFVTSGTFDTCFHLSRDWKDCGPNNEPPTRIETFKKDEGEQE